MVKLARIRPAGTDPVKLFSQAFQGGTLVITNVTGSPASASVYLVDGDLDDVTPDAGAALLFQKPVPANDLIELSLEGWLGAAADQSIAVESETGDALVFTLFA